MACRSGPRLCRNRLNSAGCKMEWALGKPRELLGPGHGNKMPTLHPLCLDTESPRALAPGPSVLWLGTGPYQ